MFSVDLPFASIWKNIEGTLSTDEGFLLKVSFNNNPAKTSPPTLSLEKPERLTSKPSRKIEKLFLREENRKMGLTLAKRISRGQGRKKLANNPMDDGRKIPTG